MTTSNITHERDAQLVDLARSGDVAPLIEHLCRLIEYRAHVLARGSGLDREDVLQEGIVMMLVEMKRALLASNPIGYLRRACTHRMSTFCLEYRCPIRVPASTQRDGKRVPVVLSLDAPLSWGSNQTLSDVLS